MHSLTLRRSNLGTWTQAVGILLFAVATALSARISVALPFSPVPLTLQVLVVVVSGLVLGPWGGFAAQMGYLQAILLGAPLTAYGLGGPAAFASPTAGYLIAFPFAAALAGYIAQRIDMPKALGRFLGGLAALVCIYSVGTLWLAGFVGGAAMAWKLGVVPFIGADLAKVVIAAGALSTRGR